MNKLEIPEWSVNLILMFLVLFILGVGMILGFCMDEMWNINKFKVTVQQTRGEYLHLPNNTLWKKVKNVEDR